MIPYNAAVEIVEQFIPEESGIERAPLVDAIRRAILLGQIEARQPLDIKPGDVPAAVYQFVWWADEYRDRFHQAGYVAAVNALQECKRKVLALHGIQSVERKPVARASSSGLRKAARA